MGPYGSDSRARRSAILGALGDGHPNADCFSGGLGGMAKAEIAFSSRSNKRATFEGRD